MGHNGALPQLALERDGSGTVLRSYVYGNERISMNSGGSVYYYLYDTQGSVVNVTSTAGAPEWTYSYDPFGASRTQTQNDPSAPANPMQYSGEMLDAPSGLYDLRARQYDTSTGLFLSQDPAASFGQTAGAYIYANDNPTIYGDPTGQTPVQFDCGCESSNENARLNMRFFAEHLPPSGRYLALTRIDADAELIRGRQYPGPRNVVINGYFVYTGADASIPFCTTGGDPGDWGCDNLYPPNFPIPRGGAWLKAFGGWHRVDDRGRDGGIQLNVIGDYVNPFLPGKTLKGWYVVSAQFSDGGYCWLQTPPSKHPVIDWPPSPS